MLIFSLLAARSMSTCDTPAWAKPLLEVLLELDVLVEEVRVLLLRVPAAAPGLVEAEAEPDGMDLLTHYFDSFAALSSWTAWRARRGRRCRPASAPTCALADRAVFAAALPCARPWPPLPLRALDHAHAEVRRALDGLVGAAHGRGTDALLRRPLVGVGRETTRSSSSRRRFWFLSATFTALAMAERSVFSMSRATDFLVKCRMESASAAFLPRMRPAPAPPSGPTCAGTSMWPSLRACAVSYDFPRRRRPRRRRGPPAPGRPERPPPWPPSRPWTSGP